MSPRSPPPPPPWSRPLRFPISAFLLRNRVADLLRMAPGMPPGTMWVREALARKFDHTGGTSTFRQSPHHVHLLTGSRRQAMRGTRVLSVGVVGGFLLGVLGAASP